MSVMAGLASVWPLAAQPYGGNAGQWYVGGDAGAVFQQNVGGLKDNGSPVPGNIEFDPGARVDLNVGYNLTENVAVEVESGFTYNGISKAAGTSLSDLGESAELWQVPILVNGIYKHAFNDRWQAYGGVGLGCVASQLNAEVPGASYNDTDFQLGYQAMLGIKYLINSHWVCDLGYKFLGTTGHEWNFTVPGTLTSPPVDPQVKTDPTYSHSILLSLTYKF